MVQGRRARQVLRVVAGGSGVWPAVTVWAAVVVLSGLAFLEGWAVLPFAAGCSLGALILVELVTASWRAGRVLMLASLVTWFACTVLVWWLVGVGFDAADALRPDPPVMALFRPAFWVGTVAFLTYWGTLVLGVARIRQRGAVHPATAH
jgi:hypothetical protein